MHQERWHKVEVLFHAALELNESDRASFLNQECAGDIDLRAELDTLLMQSEQVDDFLTDPVLTTGLNILVEEESSSLTGQRIGRYTIRALLGRGGMGEVYMAEDTRLDRRVAIKLLPAYLTGDQESILRFQREARAASGVSHPNVAHIYEEDETDGRHYLAMEYVEGMTLRRMLKYESLNVEEAIEIALQVANALVAAHSAGVVHRDIKPENIMVQSSGLAKVLDFGVAKLSGKTSPGNSPRSSSIESPSEGTNGLILGTTPYMSPEQVLGQELDARTDLWSLGVVLYEMLMGRKPFGGETRADVADAILHLEPPSLDTKEAIPDELARVVSKALTKEVSKRYQTAREVAADLKWLRQQFILETHQASGKYRSGITQPAIDEGEFASSRVGPSTESVNRSFSVFRYLTRPKILTAFLVFIFGALALSAYLLFKKPAASSSSSVSQIVRVTNSGKAIRSSISKDGKLIAFALEERGRQSLHLRGTDVGGGESVGSNVQVLLAPDERRISGIAFSPDNQFVYYSAKSVDAGDGALFRIRLTGGEPERLLTGIESAPSFSPDGQRLVFLRTGSDNSHEDLYIANSDGSGQRMFYTRRMPEFIPSPAQPSWSPDGQLILCAVGTYTDKGQQVVPLVIRVADGQPVQFQTGLWEEIWQTDWIGDGSGFVFTGRKERIQDNKQLWRMAYPSGESLKLTNDSNDYFGASITRTSGGDEQLTTLVLDKTAQLWIVDLANTDREARQLTSTGRDSFGVSWARDGRIVYGSVSSGNPDIWILKQDGSGARQLTTDQHADVNPLITADGRYIVFSSERSGVKSLWRMSSDGSGQTQLVQGTTSASLALSPEGRTIYYYSYFDGAGALWQVSVEGGAPQKIASGQLEFPATSPDGRMIAVSYKGQDSDKFKIGLIKMSDPTQPPDVIQQAPSADIPGFLRWTADGKALVYTVTRKGVSNLWVQPIDGRPAEQITKFISERIFAFDLSPDGREAICSRGETTSYVTLLKLR